MCSHRSGTGHCVKCLSGHRTIQIQVQVVSVCAAGWASAAAQHCCWSLLSMLGFAERAGTKQCLRRAWESSQGKWEQHMVQILPGCCKCDWGNPWGVQHMDGCSAVHHD